MYSLDNSYSKEDLVEWENGFKKVLGDVQLEYSCELKYDGASISITYENGKLTQAVTRGDGYQGDDVTNNINNTLHSSKIKGIIQRNLILGRDHFAIRWFEK
jgi:DNA ligase (NAD+)